MSAASAEAASVSQFFRRPTRSRITGTAFSSSTRSSGSSGSLAWTKTANGSGGRRGACSTPPPNATPDNDRTGDPSAKSAARLRTRRWRQVFTTPPFFMMPPAGPPLPDAGPPAIVARGPPGRQRRRLSENGGSPAARSRRASRRAEPVSGGSERLHLFAALEHADERLPERLPDQFVGLRNLPAFPGGDPPGLGTGARRSGDQGAAVLRRNRGDLPGPDLFGAAA